MDRRGLRRRGAEGAQLLMRERRVSSIQRHQSIEDGFKGVVKNKIQPGSYLLRRHALYIYRSVATTKHEDRKQPLPRAIGSKYKQPTQLHSTACAALPACTFTCLGDMLP